MASGNPMLSENTFRGLGWSGSRGEVMTIEGTANKTLLMLAILVITAGITWNQYFTGHFSPGLMMVGVFGGLGLAIATAFKPTWAKVTAPAYAAFEGLVLGGLSAMLESRYGGITIQAVAITMGTMGAFLIAYKTGVLRASDRMRKILIGATFGIMLVYLASMVMGFFGTQMPFIHDASPIGIGFSLLVAGIAAFNLVLDFDFIERGAASGAPKYMEWYGAFGLLVTLVWLYIEVIRLLSKLREFSK